MTSLGEYLDLLCRENTSAKEFLKLILNILHFWDDLIDKDHLLTDRDINHWMWGALIELPRNQFYVTNFTHLNTILTAAIINWEAATRIERTDDDDYSLNIAFIIRSTYIDLAVATGLLIGGRDHAVVMAVLLRKMIHDEGFEMFKEALVKESTLRNKQ